MRLSVKLLLISGLVLVVAELALFVPVFLEMRGQVIRDLQNELYLIASTAALQIDGDLHQQIRKAGDEHTIAFHRLRETLRRIRDVNDIRTENIYTFYRDGDQVRFAVMTHERPFVGHTYELQPGMVGVFEQGQRAVTDLYTDEQGQWISAYAPIRDSRDQVVGLLEVDRPAAAYFASVRRVMWLSLGFCLTSLAISAVIGSLVLRRIVIRPMQQLHEGMLALGRHDFRHRVELHTGDEFEELGETFNKLSKQLNLARMIQAHFFPDALPTHPCYELAASSTPSDATGGDYYDAFKIDAGRIAVLVADVSGHGLGPSLLMSACRSSIRALGTARLSPAQALRQLDHLLHDDLADGRFVTIIYGILDADGTFCYANAGQGPAMVVKDTTIEYLGPHRPPIGVWNGDKPTPAGHRETSIRLAPGDRLFLASDGVVDARNPAGESFGLSRVEEIVGDRSISADDAVGRIDAALTRHCHGPHRSDDVTMICVDRL